MERTPRVPGTGRRGRMSVPTPSGLPEAVGRALREAIDTGLRAAGGPAALGPARPAPPGQVTALSDTLYTDWYTRSRVPKALQPAPAPVDPPFVETLRAAHAGSYRWESGWICEHLTTGGRIVAVRGSERRALGTTEYVSEARPGLSPLPGTSVRIVSRRDSTRLSPGFWVTHSSAWPRHGCRVLRLYWNVQADGAACLVRAITEALTGMVEFCLKLPVARAEFARADAAVLYLEPADFDRAAAAVRMIYETASPDLVAAEPPLTRTLAPGLALAVTPTGTMSFGQSRCHLIAEALLEAWGRGRRDPEQLLDDVARHLAAAGVPPARPHLDDSTLRDFSL